MTKTKHSARINKERIDGTIEVIKRTVLHLHDMSKTQFKVKGVDEQIEELRNQWQITPDRNDDIRASLYVLNVNSNSRKHYHESMHRGFLWWKKGGVFELYKPTNFQINSARSLKQDLGKLEEQLASEVESEKRTEIEALIKARQGQGRFRQKLLELYSNYPLTDLDVRSLLVASHIKPQSKCNNKERLNPFSGLMLTPGIDALFDSRLITLDADGTIKINLKIDLGNQKRLGISPDMKLKIEPESQKYFEYHRNHIFQKEEQKVLNRPLIQDRLKTIQRTPLYLFSDDLFASFYM